MSDSLVASVAGPVLLVLSERVADPAHRLHGGRVPVRGDATYRADQREEFGPGVTPGGPGGGKVLDTAVLLS